jgi:hypothetical protein
LKQHLGRISFYLTCGSAVSILFSIAVSQILMALAFAALLFSGEPLKLPPIKLPLLVFMAGTVISLFLSVDPRSGTPQIRKFYVFLILLLISSTFRRAAEVRWVVPCRRCAACFSSLTNIRRPWKRTATSTSSMSASASPAS